MNVRSSGVPGFFFSIFFSRLGGPVAVAIPTAGPLLYNVIADPGERDVLNSTDARYAEVVAQLKSGVASYEETRVPQATPDPSCPHFSGINTTAPDGSTSLYIGPWCD